MSLRAQRGNRELFMWICIVRNCFVPTYDISNFPVILRNEGSISYA